MFNDNVYCSVITLIKCCKVIQFDIYEHFAPYGTYTFVFF